MTTEQADMSLAAEDRVALITGASRGIGLATARLLAQRGYRIVITGREESDLARAAADLRALHSGVNAFAGDCADPGVVNDLIGSIQRDFGLALERATPPLWSNQPTPRAPASSTAVSCWGNVGMVRGAAVNRSIAGLAMPPGWG